MLGFVCALIALVVSPAASPAATKAGGLKILRRIELSGGVGWDYLTLDAATHRLYVTRADHVSVVDLVTGKEVGEIPKTDGVHGVAVVPDSGKGVTSNGKSNTATIFDLKTLAPQGEVKTGDKPDAIIYDPASKRVFAFNGHSNDATVIDPAKGTAVGTVALGGAPEFAVADGKGHVFVNLEDKSEVVAIDSNALTVKGRWSLAPCEEPTGIAMDVESRRLFSGCANNKLAVSDADGGKVVTTLPIGAGVDANGFDPKTKLVYSSNGDGTLTVIHEESPDKFVVVENAKTEVGARTMALDPESHKVYLITAKFGPPPSPTADRPHPRGPILPGTVVILEMGQ
jgi:DNA-binding beta-propeller fold protein YncE